MIADGLAALLAEHGEFYYDADTDCPTCDCGAVLAEEAGEYAGIDAPKHRAHQAAVIRAAGWRRVIPRSVRSSFDFDVATGRPLGPPEQEEA